MSDQNDNLKSQRHQPLPPIEGRRMPQKLPETVWEFLSALMDDELILRMGIKPPHKYEPDHRTQEALMVAAQVIFLGISENDTDAERRKKAKLLMDSLGDLRMGLIFLADRSVYDSEYIVAEKKKSRDWQQQQKKEMGLDAPEQVALSDELNGIFTMKAIASTGKDKLITHGASALETASEEVLAEWKRMRDEFDGMTDSQLSDAIRANSQMSRFANHFDAYDAFTARTFHRTADPNIAHRTADAYLDSLKATGEALHLSSQLYARTVGAKMAGPANAV